MSALSDFSTMNTNALVPAFPNPNAQRNRIPGNSELIQLRAFAQSNSRIARILDEEIQQFTDSYNAINARYIQQQIELEATQSELHRARDLLIAVQKQRAALQVQQDDISALIHPVRRCPDEILGHIFELTVDEPGVDDVARMRRSIRLSSVWRRWRAVALDTPRLWNNIPFRLWMSPSSQELLRTHIIPRVKHVPTNLTVSTVHNDRLPALRICGLQDVPVIKTLHYFFRHPDDIQLVLDPGFTFPLGNMQALSLSSKPIVAPDTTPQSTTAVNLLDMIEGFPPFSKLALGRLSNLVFPTEPSDSNITNLSVNDVGKIDILKILRCFPKLESLIVRSTVVTAEDARDGLAFPRIKSISMVSTTGETCMDTLMFPQLNTLVYPGIKPESLVSFVSRHRSITHLESKMGGDTIAQIAKVAPQLLTLHIRPPILAMCSPREGSSEVPFPRLKQLTVITGLGCQRLSLPEFETLVRARCLPMRHPQGLANDVSQVIQDVQFVTKGSDKQDWHESELFKSSIQTIRTDTFPRSYVIISIRMKWPEWE